MTDKKIFSKENNLFLACFLGLLIIAVLASVKRMFVGLDIDEQYSIATIYRLACGDIPIKEVWEPHQTSSLIMVPFAYIFMKVTCGTKYLVLFLRLFGIIIQAGVCAAWYGFFKDKAGKLPALFSSFLFFVVLPKFILSPEFNNMQIWFFVLSCIYLLKGLESSKPVHFCLAGFFMLLEVLSYPSCLLVYIVFFVIIILRKRKGTIPFIAPAIVIGGAIIIWLWVNGAFSDIKICMSGILHDEAHSDGIGAKLLGYLSELPKALLFIGIYALLALAVCTLIKLIKREKGIEYNDIVRFVFCWIIIAFIDQIREWFFGGAFLAYPNYCYLVLWAAGFVLFIKDDGTLKDKWGDTFKLVYIGNIVAFFSVLLLTNLNVKATFVHLLPGGLLTLMILCSLSLGNDEKDYRGWKIAVVSVVLIATLIGQVWFVRTSNEGRCEDILFVRQKVTWGPADLIYAAYMEGYELNCDYELITETVPAGSKVLYVGNNNLVYMIGDYEVCTPSTISTPGYGKNIVDYYDINPNKIPEYVVMRKGNGELEWADDTIGYLKTLRDAEEVGENEFVRVYRLGER